MRFKQYLNQVWTWCVNHLIIVVPALVVIILIPIAIASFGKNEGEVSREFSASSPADAEELVEVSPRTEEGYIVYDMSSDVSMKKGETRTFDVPTGTKIRQYNTEGEVEFLSKKGKKYIVRAETDVSFDLVWIIKKGFENEVKPK